MNHEFAESFANYEGPRKSPEAALSEGSFIQPESWEPGTYEITLTEGNKIEGIPNRDDVEVLVNMNFTEEEDLVAIGDLETEFYLSRGDARPDMETLRITTGSTYKEMYQGDTEFVVPGGSYPVDMGYGQIDKAEVLKEVSVSRKGFYINYANDTYSIENLNLPNGLSVHVIIKGQQSQSETV